MGQKNYPQSINKVKRMTAFPLIASWVNVYQKSKSTFKTNKDSTTNHQIGV